MSKVLRLYNTYSRAIKEARLASGELVVTPNTNGSTKPIHGSLYICGPTVYSESHLGHALTYVRADLLRRVLRSLFNVKLTTVMNITDIDDKILAKARDELPAGSTPGNNPDEHPFNRVSERYYKSFVDDMDYIRVAPPDLTIKVSNQISIMRKYIQRLENKGHAYLASNGDIYFKVSSLANYQGRETNSLRDTQYDNFKMDARDFALWKAAKPGEPVWMYKSEVAGREVPGRPGWHVQCSAIASAIFGNRLDFHFGGKDLIFPHNYNEQACCCAFHGLDTSKDTNVWSANWLHSGHLVLRDEKMSKSLGNVVGIRKFIGDTSINALRLLCVDSHYRANVTFNDGLLMKMRNLEHKVSAFRSYLADLLRRLQDGSLDENQETTGGSDLGARVDQVHEDIIDGVCDDFDLSKGLSSILELSKTIYGMGAEGLRPRELVIVWHLLEDWCSMVGLDYGSASEVHNEKLMILVKDFRDDIRAQVIGEIKRCKLQKGAKTEETTTYKNDHLESLLKSCDNVRGRLDELGFVIRDNKTKL